MPTFENLYEKFQLEPSQRESLQNLAGLASLDQQQPACLLVETVVVNEGERTVISIEKTYAQLVKTHQGNWATRQPF